MKRILSMLLIAMLVFSVSLAEEVPQPEGGKPFEGYWALMGGLIEITYEEEGYRVTVDLLNQEDSIITHWEYPCYYDIRTNALESIFASKSTYAYDVESKEATFIETEYEGLLDESKSSLFHINDQYKLIWDDGYEHAGEDLEFVSIGRFPGVWRNDAEEVVVSFTWEGLVEESYYYTVQIRRGGEETFTEFTMQGLYDPDTNKLTASGTAIVFTKDAIGNYEPQADSETYDAVFSMLENGHLLFETANGIELEYDIMGEYDLSEG